MSETLVIVESPAKAKTITKYLPKDYSVIATMGHVIDLPKSRLGIEIDNDFEPEYIKIRGKGKLLTEIKKKANKADDVLLATDPDREGEAISWHVANFLGIDPEDKCRIEFHEITKKAVSSAIDQKRAVDMNLVNSQQARRVLDRLVGYSLSPFLWKKVKTGLSGGRVQSVVMRIIADREDEINNFIPQEYWNLDLHLHKKDDKLTFLAKFYGEKGKKLTIPNEEEAQRLYHIVKNNSLFIENVKKRVRYQNAPLPFTTSTLQQDAYRTYGFTTQRTMRVAQQLYEGVSIAGKGLVGLVTYIRTDSTRIADEAKYEARHYIEKNFGKDYLGTAKRTTAGKNVQDAHEAIRPTDINLLPVAIRESLSGDQFKLYKLIWERLIASQMARASYYVTDVDIRCEELLFKAKGEMIKFEGFLKATGGAKKTMDNPLPELEVEEEVFPKKINKEQKFTTPPARYTEGTLVKVLEENGIGRPSTYAPTISTIKTRNYVEIKEKRFHPTELGMTVNELMKIYFSDIVNIKFTADMEEKLDKISEGNTRWKTLIEEFYKKFKHQLDHAQEDAEKVTIEDPLSDEFCELCGKQMVIKNGRYGKFLACPGFPECKNTKAIVEKTGGICPECGGNLVVKKSKRGRTFYGCENYPKCEFTTWDLPLAEKCPNCEHTLFQKGLGKKKKKYCASCDYTE